MKNVSTKIAYMVIGSLLTIIGYHFGNIDNNTADAQEKVDTPIVDEIQCRRLVIVDEDDTTRIVLGTDDNRSGLIAIGNGSQRQLLLLHADSIILADHPNVEKKRQVTATWNKEFENNPEQKEPEQKELEQVVHIGTTEEGAGFIITKNKDGTITDSTGLGSKTSTYKKRITRRTTRSIPASRGFKSLGLR